MSYRLLSDDTANTKFAKTRGTSYLVVGLSLAQSNTSGKNVCGSASPKCIEHCVGEQGMAGVFPSIGAARIAKTKRFFEDRESFFADLRSDLSRAVKLAARDGKQVACRLNTFSDLPWEQIAPWIFVEFPTIQFYDYTKIRERYRKFLAGGLPANYHLTFSRSELNERAAIEFLLLGGSVAVVFDINKGDDIPAQWHGFPVFNGDETDLRYLDPRGTVICLRAKGTLRMDKDSHGFVSQHLAARDSLLNHLS
jgi:hypothetical protein